MDPPGARHLRRRDEPVQLLAPAGCGGEAVPDEMRTPAGKLALLLVAVLAGLALCGAGAAVAKKRKGTRVFDATSMTNAPIPARSDPNGPWGVLSTTIEAPKSFKG